MATNPIPYTIKSLSGPLLFVIAAFFWGRSRGRNECSLRRQLNGLPKTGRIPMSTVKRVMKKMPRKVSSCKITPAALREGMEVEREHSNVTRGSVLMTAKIAASHLCESKSYYKKLKKYVE